MTQEPLLPKIGGYVDGELTPAERSEVEEFIEGSTEYRSVAETLQWVDQLGRADGDRVPKVSETEWSHLKQVVLRDAQTAPLNGPIHGGQSNTVPFPRPASRSSWAALAAVVLFGLVLAWALSSLNPGAGPDDARVVKPTPPEIPDSGIEESPGADDDKAIVPEEPAFAERDLYAPKVNTEDDYTGVFYDEDF